MVNKDTTFEQFKNSVITPNLIEQGLTHLPFNYIKQSQALMKEELEAERFPRVFSKQYIIEVRNRDAFNQDVLNCIVFIGLKNMDIIKTYGAKKKKAPSA